MRSRPGRRQFARPHPLLTSSESEAESESSDRAPKAILRMRLVLVGGAFSTHFARFRLRFVPAVVNLKFDKGPCCRFSDG